LLLFLFAHLPSFDSPPPTPSFDSPPLTATTKQRQLTEGKVVAVGPGRRAPLSGEVIPVSVKEGDTVLLPEYGGTPLKHEGKELLLYRDDELLGVDDIAEVGPFGDFLSLASTLKFMRGQSQPKLIDRRVREDWAAAGGKDLHQRALEEARRILATHVPETLPEEVVLEIRRIVDAADAAAEGSAHCT
jgi:co-chaperonin GroES (HSP10)